MTIKCTNHVAQANEGKKYCPECGASIVDLKILAPAETDYITLLACTSPQRALVAWMAYNKPDDSYTIKKCSEPLTHRGAQALAESWAAALKLEIR